MTMATKNTSETKFKREAKKLRFALKVAQAELTVAERQVKGLLCNPTYDLRRDVHSYTEWKGAAQQRRGEVKSLLATLAQAPYNDRRPLEAEVWRRAHRDQLGYLGDARCRENRTILVYTDLGTCAALLSSLTVAELLERV